MRCAAVSLGLLPTQVQAESVAGRKPALLRAQMASTYSVWVEPTGDFAGTACVQQQDCPAVIHKLQ